MNMPIKDKKFSSAREKFLGLSLESTRKSYYPQLQAQLELIRENERRLLLLTDNLPARISYVDADERYVFVNREYEKAFELPRDQIIGRQVRSILDPDNYMKVKHFIRHALEGYNTKFETIFDEADGVSRWFEIHYVPDIDPKRGVTGFYDLTLDLTEKKIAEQEKTHLQTRLLQAKKMEAIGTLAGGIAHDFNNILMGIQGRASLMSVALDESHQCMEHVLAIEEYVKCASNLTRQILGFARGGKYQAMPIDVNKTLQGSAQMFARTRKEIRVHYKLYDSPLVVEADRRQLEQVFLNIFVNAWQAMPSGGDLFLETEPVFLETQYCRSHQIAAGRYIKIAFTDTGTGMDETTLQKVFDPFFTTKEKSRGTGLGMASAYGIIKNHGGTITVYSETGHGSTFNIYLPMTEKPVGQDIFAEEKIFRGTETILLVDDEKVIIEVGKAMLSELGYQVITAPGGREALQILDKQKDVIQLVILDMVMPDMDGGTTFERIRTIDPDMKVLLSSGYSLNGHADKIVKKGCNGFIQKPFSLKDLSRKIRQILDGDDSFS